MKLRTIGKGRMQINRAWSLHNKWTFQMKPVAELLTRYVGDGIGWIDPFAGMSSPAEFKNDINPDTNAQTHIEASEWITSLDSRKFTGCLLDPPYSLEQVKRSYENHGLKFDYYTSHEAVRWSRLKWLISRIIETGGLTICFGWNSNGFGKVRGFKLEEILLVHHGSAKNDTIITVERKIQSNF